MGVALLEPGSVIIDYAWNDVWKTDPGALPRSGIGGVCRYVSLDNTKDLFEAEVAAHDGVGTLMILNWEANTGRPLAGYSVGVSDGQRSAARAAQLGYSRLAAIIVSVDFEIVPSQYGVFAEYLRGFVDGMQNQYPLGVYGHGRLMDFCVTLGYVEVFWQCSAWSYGYRSPASHMLQLVGEFYPSFKPTDKNIVLKPIFGWRPSQPDDPIHPPDPPNPTPSEVDDVQYLINSEPYPRSAEIGPNWDPPAVNGTPAGYWPAQWIVWELMPDGSKRWVNGAEWDCTHDLPTTKVTARTTGQLQQLPAYHAPATADQVQVTVNPPAVNYTPPAVNVTTPPAPTHFEGTFSYDNRTITLEAK